MRGRCWRSGWRRWMEGRDVWTTDDMTAGELLLSTFPFLDPSSPPRGRVYVPSPFLCLSPHCSARRSSPLSSSCVSCLRAPCLPSILFSTPFHAFIFIKNSHAPLNTSLLRPRATRGRCVSPSIRGYDAACGLARAPTWRALVRCCDSACACACAPDVSSTRFSSLPSSFFLPIYRSAPFFPRFYSFICLFLGGARRAPSYSLIPPFFPLISLPFPPLLLPHFRHAM